MLSDLLWPRSTVYPICGMFLLEHWSPSLSQLSYQQLYVCNIVLYKINSTFQISIFLNVLFTDFTCRSEKSTVEDLEHLFIPFGDICSFKERRKKTNTDAGKSLKEALDKNKVQLIKLQTYIYIYRYVLTYSACLTTNITGVLHAFFDLCITIHHFVISHRRMHRQVLWGEFPYLNQRTSSRFWMSVRFLTAVIRSTTHQS